MENKNIDYKAFGKLIEKKLIEKYGSVSKAAERIECGRSRLYNIVKGDVEYFIRSKTLGKLLAACGLTESAIPRLQKLHDLPSQLDSNKVEKIIQAEKNISINNQYTMMSPQEIENESTEGAYYVTINGPKINSTIAVLEEEDISIVELMLKKIRKKMKRQDLREQ